VCRGSNRLCVRTGAAEILESCVLVRTVRVASENPARRIRFEGTGRWSQKPIVDWLSKRKRKKETFLRSLSVRTGGQTGTKNKTFVYIEIEK
jgi:hypothetical protein